MECWWDGSLGRAVLWEAQEIPGWLSCWQFHIQSKNSKEPFQDAVKVFSRPSSTLTL